MSESLEFLLRVATIVAIAGLLGAICLSDAAERRIPNRLVGWTMVIAVAFHAFAPSGAGLFDRHLPGAIGFGPAALGALYAFGAFLILHVMRIMGAGDVKLMAAMGAVFGAAAVPGFILTVFLSGGVLVAARMFDGERRRRLAANLRVIAYGRLAAATGAIGPEFDPRTDTADRLPYGLAIGLASIVWAGTQWAGVTLPWSL